MTAKQQPIDVDRQSIEDAAGDPELAAIVRRLNPPAPFERIVRTEHAATALNMHKLDIASCERVVTLACGHRAVTKAAKRVRCTQCLQLMLDGKDYQMFRFGADA